MIVTIEPDSGPALIIKSVRFESAASLTKYMRAILIVGSALWPDLANADITIEGRELPARPAPAAPASVRKKES